MAEPYSQFRALLAITKASLKAILRSPSTVVFSLGFPLIFILVFGFVGEGVVKVRVGIDHSTDTSDHVFQSLKKIGSLKLVTDEPEREMVADMKKGRLTAILKIIRQRQDPNGFPRYTLQVTTSSAGADKIQLLQSVLRDAIERANEIVYKNNPTVATVVTETVPGRAYKQIDFILPGMLGFSLLSAGIFGTAFLFFSLRQTLVLKRFFATPVNRSYILLGEGLARLIFQVFGAIVIIGIGYYFFGYTLIHGFETFLVMLLLSAFGLAVFMGFGFVVSGVAKNESTIPPIANLITLPQFLLAGTFFPIDVFPAWLQPICRIMPLTYLNDALRKIAFEGARIWDVYPQILVLSVWGIVIYAVAIKVFKWE